MPAAQPLHLFPIPGMPDGKPANTRCVQLDEQQRCKGSPLRPAVCAGLQPGGDVRQQPRRRHDHLLQLEADTAP